MMGFKEILIIVLYAFVLMSSVIYSWHKLVNKKINFKSYKMYLALAGMMLTSSLNFFIVNKYYRIILITGFLVLFYKLIFNGSIQKCILSPIYTQFLIFICEGVYAVILTIIFKDNVEKILETALGTILTNVIIALSLAIIVNIKPVRRMYNKILDFTDKIGHFQLIIACFLLMIVSNTLLMTSYYKMEFLSYFIFNMVLMFICIIIIIHSFRTQNNYNKVSDQYNIAKTSLRDYEAMMTKYRVANHENKNLLLTVRAMTVNKEKNIPEYIDSIIENKFADDEKLLFEMGVIPTGGLRATIYSEILKIKEKKINYNLNIDRKISTIDLIELDTNAIIDICKVLGVFIDNAIEAVNKHKNRYINIDMYILEDKLCIKVSNNYSGKIDISKINEEGYTTKGNGHGYGLPLVNKIINNDKYLESETEINKKIFSQILKIKYKKNH